MCPPFHFDQKIDFFELISFYLYALIENEHFFFKSVGFLLIESFIVLLEDLIFDLLNNILLLAIRHQMHWF